MANICDTTYKVTGSSKALNDLWRTLQEMKVNVKNIWLGDLAKHYDIDPEEKHCSVRGEIYWADYDEEAGLLSFDTESAWCACIEFFDELNHVLNDELSISFREIECGCEVFLSTPPTDQIIKEIIIKINRRPRLKLVFSTPVAKFFKIIA